MSPNNNCPKGINRVVVKPVALAAGILGLLQGIVWTVLSVLAICCYEGAIEIGTESGAQYYKFIYICFLNKDLVQSEPNELLIHPQDFFIFMCFYVVFSVIWMLLSGTLIWAMVHEQWHLGKGLFGGWSTITILITIVDIILTSLIGYDYGTILPLSDSTNEILVTYGIVMSIAARGYILCIMNIIFAGVILKFAIDIVLNDNEERTMPIIHGYETTDINSSWLNPPVKDFWTQPQPTAPKTPTGYDNHGFVRSQSFVPTENANIYTELPSRSNFRAPPDVSSFSDAIRTATIGGNKAKGSPLHYVSGPVAPPIPSPDYTPPSTPNALKSVLRSRSNFN